MKQVLSGYYLDGFFYTFNRAKIEDYTQTGSFNFFSREALKSVSTLIDFNEPEFGEYFQSQHRKICALKSRINQREWNAFVELTKFRLISC